MCAAWAPVARCGRPVTMASLSSPSARPQSVPRNAFSTGTGSYDPPNGASSTVASNSCQLERKSEPVSPWSSMPLCLLCRPT